jgi:V/A-type H+-transporting ATPase subunit I
MIVPAKVLRVRLIVFHEDGQKLLDGLRGKGIFHFTDYSEYPERWSYKGVPNSEPYDDLLTLYNDIEGLIAAFEAEARRGFLEDMFPKPLDVKPSGLAIGDIRKEADRLRGELDTLEKEKEELEATRADVATHMSALELLGSFRKDVEKEKVPPAVRAFFGEVGFDELPPLKMSLDENEVGKYVFYRKIVRDDENRAVMLLFSDEAGKDVVAKILQKHSFQSIPIPEKRDGLEAVMLDVKEVISSLERKEMGVRGRIEEKGAKCLGDLRSYLARVKLDVDMMKVRNMIGRTDSTYLVGGWIKEKDRGRLEQAVKAAADGRAEIFYYEPDVRKGDIPVALENPGFIKPFELLTRMFSPPNYGEIDPTPFLAVAFVLFFGLMFADMFDALLLFIVSFAFYRRFSGSPDAKNIGEIALICSVSALAFGVVGGEFAGFSVWTKHEILQPANLLLFALFLGLVQIVLGYIIGSVNAVREGDVRELLGGKLGWLLIIAGIGLAYFVMWEYAALAIAGLVLIFGFKGIREALDLTRLLSNLLSYVRLLALNMAHVGLSATFASIVGGLFSYGFAGQLSAGIIIIVAHVFLVVVSIFAVFAHALRLQYVEFFSKFYEGGGTIFNPF